MRLTRSFGRRRSSEVQSWHPLICFGVGSIKAPLALTVCFGLHPRHVTQFTKIGWKYLANGSGSGELPHGGYYATWVDPSSQNFTMNFVKISRRVLSLM